MIQFILVFLLFLTMFQTYTWLSSRNEIESLRKDVNALLLLVDTQHEINTAVYLIAEGLTKRVADLESNTDVDALSELYAIHTKRIDVQDTRVHYLERAMKAVCESGGLYPFGFNPISRREPDISGQQFYNDITKPENEKK